MIGSQLFDLKEMFSEKGIIFCYSGYFTEDTLLGIGDAIKKDLLLDETDAKTSRVIFSIFVEQVQNIIRYSEETASRDNDKEVRYGILVVGREDSRFFVGCGNKIKAGDVPRLEKVLTNIQKMDNKELKKAWKQGLRDGPPEGSKGAGIGFIDIARKAKGGFEFEFKPRDDENTFFSMKAYI